MGDIEILHYTFKDPLTCIGLCAGVCWGAKTGIPEKDRARALDCIERGHERTEEFPDVYCVIDGYSAKCVREIYTHIGGLSSVNQIY